MPLLKLEEQAKGSPVDHRMSPSQSHSCRDKEPPEAADSTRPFPSQFTESSRRYQSSLVQISRIPRPCNPPHHSSFGSMVINYKSLPLLVLDALQAVLNDTLVDSGTGPITQQALPIQVPL